MRDRHGDDLRGFALFCFSRQNEALAAKVNGDAQQRLTAHGICNDSGWYAFGLSWAAGGIG